MKRAAPGAAPRRLAKGDYTTLAEFRYLLRQFGAFSEDAARDAGLTAQQHQALLAIKGFPGREAATHSVVGLVDRLAARGLIHREHDKTDRRRVMILLTPKAETLLLGLSLAHRDELRRLAPLLRELLEKVEGAGE